MTDSAAQGGWSWRLRWPNLEILNTLNTSTVHYMLHWLPLALTRLWQVTKHQLQLSWVLVGADIIYDVAVPPTTHHPSPTTIHPNELHLSSLWSDLIWPDLQNTQFKYLSYTITILSIYFMIVTIWNICCKMYVGFGGEEFHISIILCFQWVVIALLI